MKFPTIRAMVRVIALVAVLFGLWLALSGKTDNVFLLTLGAVSSAGIAALAWRMGVLDSESLPLRILRPDGIWRYWGWLILETCKANIAVARIILSRDCDTRQRLFWIPSGQVSDLARAIYANSITLTPGTVSVDMDDDKILIHALSFEMCDSLEEMAQKIRKFDISTSKENQESEPLC